ncbi:OmpA family protein [Rhodocyclus tenuis]|uniref:Outer membrane protein OmpA-like peptidoglycan-associated protein n=1 Tax=Rhodocyclus tenuis TaxID=1066 RepID=A0A840G976_RHOTE|nr:OmpA family protein [Rhodocyclus tenuis]MBB4247450.1 outer membrane protein OmpA-like peptidoglycan-associated protein [Rhodocyclus tenuis]
MNMRFYRPVYGPIGLITLAAALSACGTVPDRNYALDQARTRYVMAQNDPQVLKLAPGELKRAEETLRLAEQSSVNGAPPATVDHLAYMTKQRVTIAQETASSRYAQSITAAAAGERDRTRLGMRTREADQANADARRSEARVERSDARANDLAAQLQELKAKKTDRGLVVTLGDVLFDNASSSLTSASSGDMAKLAAVFRQNPLLKASIEGYTDSVGSANANYALSERRANAVLVALVKLGVPADRLSTQAHGQESPVANNATAAGRQLNRRVEIVFAQDAPAR